MLAIAAAAAAVTVELDASTSPCESQHCTRVERLIVAGLGTVEIDRISPPDPAGRSLVLSVKHGDDSRWLSLAIDGDNCATGTCVGRETKSVHLVRLDPKGDPAFGVEIDSTVTVSHTFKELGPAYSLPEQYRLACVARNGAIDCKSLVLGGRGEDCRALGWHGTAVRFTCTGEEPLVVPRRPDTDGLSQTDLERLQQLDADARSAIVGNRNDCAELVKQIDKVIARDHDAFAIARGHLPSWLKNDFSHDVTELSGYPSCLLDESSQHALERLFAALGTPTSFKVQRKP